MADLGRPMRVLYLAGPGDVASTFRAWLAGRDDPSQVSVTYSGQFFSLVRDLGATAVVVANHARPDRVEGAGIVVTHEPIPWRDRGGLRFHAGTSAYWMRQAVRAVRLGCDTVVVNAVSHLFPFAWLRTAGVRVVPTLHCVLETQGGRSGAARRVIGLLDRSVLGWSADRLIAVSERVAEQARRAGGRSPRPVERFLPLYRASTFADARPADPTRRPFRVLFAGQVRAWKGVFDLLDAAASLSRPGEPSIRLDLAGDGEDLPAVRTRLEALGLSGRVVCHGHCNRDRLAALYRDAHAVAVPTRSDMPEGLNKVAIEAVLALRPVIVTEVCPALELIGEAALRIAPGDPAALAYAIRDLALDRRLYDRLGTACERLRPPFFDPTRSWGAALGRVLASGSACPQPPGAVVTP